MPSLGLPTPDRRIPRWLSRGRLGGLLRANERGVLVWAPGGLEERDWGASVAAWSWAVRCFNAASDPLSGALILLASDGLYRAASQGGIPSYLSPALPGGPLALAAGGTRAAFLSPDGALAVLSLEGPVFQRKMPAEILALSFSPEGLLAVALAASTQSAPALFVLDPQGNSLARIELAAPCSSLLFSSRGLLVAAHGRAVSFWTHDGHAAGALEEQPGAPSALAEDPANARLAVGYRGGPIALWNFPIHGGLGTYAGGVDGHRATVRGLRFLAGGAGLASVGEDQDAVLWGLPGKRAQQRMEFGSKGIEAAAIEPGGRWLLGHGDGSVSVLGRDGRREREMGQHPGGTFAVAWSESGALLASGGADGRVCVWGSRRGELKAEVSATGAVQGLAFQGSSLLVADARGLGRWLLSFVSLRTSLGTSKLSPVPGVNWGAKGGAVAVHGEVIAAADGARVWLGDGRGAWRAPMGLGGHLWSLAFGPDGRLLACGGEGFVTLCDARFAERLFRVDVPGGRLWSVAFEPGGQQLAAGCQDGVLRVISLSSGRVEEELPGHTGEVTGVGWSREGLFSAGRDGALVGWERGPTEKSLLP